jgi:hypothetical protein
MRPVPAPGDIIPLETGDATVLETRNRYGDVIILATREHPLHPFATWKWDEGGLYAGNYFKTLTEAELNLEER